MPSVIYPSAWQRRTLDHQHEAVSCQRPRRPPTASQPISCEDNITIRRTHCTTICVQRPPNEENCSSRITCFTTALCLCISDVPSILPGQCRRPQRPSVRSGQLTGGLCVSCGVPTPEDECREANAPTCTPKTDCRVRCSHGNQRMAVLLRLRLKGNCGSGRKVQMPRPKGWMEAVLSPHAVSEPRKCRAFERT